MAAGDAQEDGAPAADGAGQDGAPEPLREPERAGEQTSSDHAPVAPNPSEEEEDAPGAEQEDEPAPQEGWEEDGGKEEEGEYAEEEEEEVEEEGEEEEAPTHLPFAPPDELPDDTTTVDPTYTISLIRQLIPLGSNAEKDFRQLIPLGSNAEKDFSDKQRFPEERSANSDDGESTQPDKKDPSEKSDKQGFPEEKSVNSDDGESTQRDNKDPSENIYKQGFPEERSVNSDDGESTQPDNKDPSEKSDNHGFPEERSVNSDDEESTQPDNKDPSEKSDEHGFPEERSANSGDGKSTQPDNEDPWEESGCILWDLASSKPQAELMMKNLILEVLLSNLHVTKSSRVKEICLGIMANLACHESLVNAICLENGLIDTVVEQLFLDDTGCLSETFRLLTAILGSSASVSCAEALLPDKILSRILWIVGNTMSSTLLEQGIDFISNIIDNQDVIAMLIQPWLKVGLVDDATKLLTNEIEKSPDEKLDRSGCLDMILHFMEELSAIHSVAEVMSACDQLIKLLVNMVKSPDKVEVATYCASVVIIIANILTDGKHLVPKLSHDLPFLEGLFDILPQVPDDNQARYALWCTLSRFLAQAQETEMNSSSLDQFASLFLGRFTIIKDDLESHRIDEDNLSAEDAYVKGWTSTCLRAISFVMERWIKEKSSQREKDAPVTGNSIDNARKLLSYCEKMLN